VPVPEKSGSVFTYTSPGDGDAESDDKCFSLLTSLEVRSATHLPNSSLCHTYIGLRVLSSMQASNGERRSYGARERQLLLENVKLAQWNGEEHAIVSTARREDINHPCLI